MSDPLYRTTGLSLDEFAKSHWGTVPLLQRAARLFPGGFDDLLSLAAVDELLSRRGLRTPFVRMTRDGDVIPAARYTRSGGAGAEIADQVADDKILAEFSSGATLVLQGLHRIWPPLQDFAGELTAQLGHPIQINAYVTPPQNTGFSPHYDVHDVFVLQFAGRKHWKIHEPVIDVPLRDQPWSARKAAVAARAAETPSIDTVLECGDALYLPRGYIHSAIALGEISGHLTIGVHPVTRQVLADRIFASLAEDVDVRHALPPGFDPADENAIDLEVEATIAAIRRAVDRIDRKAIARRIGAHLAAATRPAPLRPLEQSALAASLDPARRLRARPGLRLTLAGEHEAPAIEVFDRIVRLDATAREAAKDVVSGRIVTAGDLPGMSVADGLTLLSQLLREGIVVPA
jgi:ribosomal protein L16 Arg81 hydroxylase